MRGDKDAGVGQTHDDGRLIGSSGRTSQDVQIGFFVLSVLPACQTDPSMGRATHGWHGVYVCVCRHPRLEDKDIVDDRTDDKELARAAAGRRISRNQRGGRPVAGRGGGSDFSVARRLDLGVETNG